MPRHTRAQHFEAMYARELLLFRKAYPAMPAVPLHWTAACCADERGPCLPMNVAQTEYDDAGVPIRIVFVRRAIRLGAKNWRGIIRHELGHAADTDWASPNSERRADKIAERVTGVKIRYDKRDLQTIGSGTHPRPRRLPR